METQRGKKIRGKATAQDSQLNSMSCIYYSEQVMTALQMCSWGWRGKKEREETDG